MRQCASTTIDVAPDGASITQADSTADEIARLAHHGAVDPDLWDQASARLRDWLHASQVAFLTHDTLTRQGRIQHGAGFNERHRALYQERYGTLNVWLNAEPGIGETHTGTELVPNFGLVRSEFYKSWLRPQRAFHSLVAIIEQDGQIRCSVIALRALEAGAFSAEEKRRLSSTLPALRCASELRGRVAEHRRRAEILLDLLDRLPEAALVVDGEGHPQVMNSAARTLLARGDGGIALSPAGVLVATSPEGSAELRRLIRTATATGGESSAAAGELTLGRGLGEPPLVLWIAPLPRSTAETGSSCGLAAVFTTPCEPAAVQRLSSFYELTPAQARLASLVVAGRSLVEAARALRISRNTARTHMKRIYAKTDTHRQADLVRLLTAGLAPLD